jgi:hypothetical protein
MAVFSIRLANSQQEQLAKVCEAEPEAIERAVDAIASAKITVKPQNLRNVVFPIVGQEIGDALIGLATNLKAFAKRSQTSSDDIVEAIQQQIENSEWPSEKKDKWSKRKPLFRRLLDAQSIALSAKATDLLYDFDHLLLSSRIITDMRPIFDDERKKILGAVITHTLRLEWYSVDGDRRSISLAIDAGDIENLKRICEFAVQKASQLEKLASKNEIEARLANEAGNDPS